MKSEHMTRILIKENEELKKLMKDKISSNEMISSMLSILEIQRERINFLEEGKSLIDLSV